jgi:2-C-methyl-D-erythritol 4-phosphate cytidylyltransferase
VTTWAVVVAAGRASRFGRPKQYEILGGRRVLDWSLRAARATCDGVVAVVAPQMAAQPEPGADVVVAGGLTRSASVRCGLAAVPSDATVVVVHDAARPLAGVSLFKAVLDAVARGADGAVCAVQVADTVKRVEGTRVTETLDRSGLFAVQTPQAFVGGVLRAAHEGEPEATDDAALVEAAGGRVVVVEGDPRNRKLTDPLDLVVAEALVATLP